MTDGEAQTVGAPTIHAVEFRGRGAEYFRIWIVNVALTLLTLGIYSAWAKVRTQRYFYGNTYLDGHSFEYHGKAWRILIGRVIALALLLGYSASVLFVPPSFALWVLIAGAALPWLANASIRFNARNTSWRNVHFNFHATYFEAFIAYVVWSAAALTLFPLIPLARRVHDYFYINHHRFGGHAFKTEFRAGRVYAIYLFGFVLIVGILLAVVALIAGLTVLATRLHNQIGNIAIPVGADDVEVVFLLFVGLGAALLTNFVTTLVTNLSIGSTVLEGGFKLASRASGVTVAWIAVTNLLLTLATLGLFHPFARIRLARSRMGKYAVIATGDIDAFTSEALDEQSAIGQEIAGVFDFGFGL